MSPHHALKTLPRRPRLMRKLAQAAPDQKKTRPLAPSAHASQTAATGGSGRGAVTRRRRASSAGAVGGLWQRGQNRCITPDALLPSRPPRPALTGIKGSTLHACGQHAPPAGVVAPQAEHHHRDDARALQPGRKGGRHVLSAGWGRAPPIPGREQPPAAATAAAAGRKARLAAPANARQAAHLRGRVGHVEGEVAGGQHRHALRAWLHAVPAQPPGG